MHRVAAWKLACLAVGLSVGICPAQRLLFTFRGQTARSYFGNVCMGAGDVDRDGYPDLLIASPSYSSGGVGKVEIFSGKDGRRGLTLSGVAANTWFGYAVDVGGDADGDGFGDLLVGAPNGNNRQGQVFVFSGRTGALMREVKGSFQLGGFGRVIKWLGDVNRDGKDDILVGEPAYTPRPGYGPYGRAHVFSGADGKRLFLIDESVASEARYLEDPGDWNKDGHADFLVVGANGGRAYANIYSGKDGTLLWRSPNLTTIWSTLLPGDVSGDGVEDLLLTNMTSIDCISGKDGKLLYTVTDGGRSAIGVTLCKLGDVDKDGFPDFAGAASVRNGIDAYVAAYSGKTGKELYRIPAGQSYLVSGSAGDIDRDGVVDLVFATLGSSTVPGTVRVFSAARTVSPFRTFGTACSGRPLPPTLRVLQEPRIGNDFVLEVRVQVVTTGGLIVGFSDKTWQGRSLPLDLAPIGMQGCKLWVSWFATVPMWSGGGAWQWKVKIPFDYTLIGAPFFMQSFVPDVRANQLGIATSQGGRAIVGT